MDQPGLARLRAWDQFKNAFGLAVDSIRGHKLRSFLTLLGVIIGGGERDYGGLRH